MEATLVYAVRSILLSPVLKSEISSDPSPRANLKVSFPLPPLRVSLPSPPSIMLLTLEPVSESLKSEPMTFSILVKISPLA